MASQSSYDAEARMLEGLRNLVHANDEEAEFFIGSIATLVSDAEQKKTILSKGLFIAAEYDWIKGAELLIKFGGDPDAIKETGETPLHCAIRDWKLGVINLLCDHVTDWTKRSRSGESVLDLACRIQAPHLIQKLQNIVFTKVGRIEMQNKLFYTALIEAIETENRDIVQILIDGGTDVNLNLDTDMGPPLRQAAELGSVDVVDCLLSAGADIEATCRRLRQTPLMCASEYGHASVVERLLEAGADIDRQTEQCSTALTLACHFGYLDVVNLLLEKGANPEVRNVWGFTPLFMAADSPEIVQRLLPYNLDINEICGDRGEAAIHLASVVGNKETVEVMLEAGGDIDVPTWQNETCIWLAAWKGHVDLARMLLQLNCFKDMPSNGCQVFAWDYTPLEIALGSGQYDIAKMILISGGSITNRVYFNLGDIGPDPTIPWFKMRPEVMTFSRRSPHTYKWLQNFLRNARTLKHLCILILRNMLGKSIELRIKVNKIHLPKVLRQQILWEDLS